jgi:hypothetical protein
VELIQAAIKVGNTLLAHLSGDVFEDLSSLPEIVDSYSGLKQRLGKTEVAQGLGLKEQELVFFEKALREAGRRCKSGPEQSAVELRQQDIATLRFLSWVETIGTARPDLDLSMEITSAPTEDQGRQQVRAIELLLRALINESYETQDALLERLKGLFKSDVVVKWQRSGDKGDVLTGTMFSELASLFVNKQEFSRYSVLFATEEFLVYLRDQRKTVQSFLEDIRRARNAVAHNKKLSAVQLRLLDHYFTELTSPLQAAFDQGGTSVNPDDYLEASVEELREFVDGLSTDLLEVQEDVEQLREALGATEAKVGRLQGGLLYLVAGIVLAMVVAGIVGFQTKDIMRYPAQAEQYMAWAAAKSKRGMQVAGIVFVLGVLRLFLNRFGVPLPGSVGLGLLGRFVAPLKAFDERLAGGLHKWALCAYAVVGMVYFDQDLMLLPVLLACAFLL